MSFVPPTFGKFGKSVKDLFDKKFDAKNQIKYVRKTADGLTVDQGVTFTDKGNRGTVNVKYNAKNIGEFEGEVSTDAKTNSKFQAKLTKLPVKNLTVTLAVNSVDKDKDFNGPVASAEAEYSQEYAAVTAKVVSDQIVHKATVTGAVGFDGFSVGGSIGVNATQSIDVNNPAVGVEYNTKDATVTVYSSDNLNVANASVFYKYARNLQFGASAAVNLAELKTTVQAGADYQMNAATQLKGLLVVPTGNVSASDASVAVEHRLVNPQLAVGFASTYNVRGLFGGPIKASKFAFYGTFGDY